MHQTVISTFFLAVLKFTARCPKQTFITDDQQITKIIKNEMNVQLPDMKSSYSHLNTDCEHVMQLKRYLNFKSVQSRSVNVP